MAQRSPFNRRFTGKQTIYRWWPSKGAVIAEAMRERARQVASTPNTGSVRDDLERFFSDTFAAAREPGNRRMLKDLMASAQTDPHIAEAISDFTAARRDVLRAVLQRGDDSLGHERTELLVDLAYGFLWYRVLLDHGSLDRIAAEQLADLLAGLVDGGPGSS